MLWLDGRDLRQLPLLARKRTLKRNMPSVESHVRYAAHVEGRGVALFDAACRRDLEGIVAKWKHGTYQSSQATGWMTVKNPTYSQSVGREELFDARVEVASSARAPRLVFA